MEQPITLTNVGNAPISVGEVELFSASPDEFALSFALGQPWPVVLEPYDEATGEPTLVVYASYVPLDTFADTAVGDVRSTAAHGDSAFEMQGSGQKFASHVDIHARMGTHKIWHRLCAARSHLGQVRNTSSKGSIQATAGSAGQGKPLV